ncbi:MAG: hypothetical protein NTW10_00790 [Bacteroidetes bacterium]|nr:hypothetical protein [Bacteroidota bacterium]
MIDYQTKNGSRIKPPRVVRSPIYPAIAKEESLVEFLIAELDEIYYPGYSEEIMTSEPEKFNWELAELEEQFV